MRRKESIAAFGYPKFPTATGAASFLGGKQAGGGVVRRRIKREQNTGRSENDPDVQRATPARPTERGHARCAAPRSSRSIGSIQFQTPRRDIPEPEPALPCRRQRQPASQVVGTR